MRVNDLMFKTTEAARVSGLDRLTLAAWLARYWPEAGKLAGSVGGGSRGSDRVFKFRHLMVFALTKELVDAGASASHAANAATEFFQFGEVDQKTGQVLRKPGLPYQDWRKAATLVALRGQATAILRYVPGEENGSLLDRITVRLGGDVPLWGGFVVADARKPFCDLCRQLGADPDKVMDELYGRTEAVGEP